MPGRSWKAVGIAIFVLRGPVARVVPPACGPVAGLQFRSCPGMLHVAFVVDDLLGARVGEEVLIQPNSPAEGVTVAFIVDNGAPIEFLEFDRPEEELCEMRI